MSPDFNTNNPGSLRVAIYARISTRHQSCEGQIRELTAHALSKGWHIEKIYSDEGSGATAQRKVFSSFMAHCRRGDYDAVLIYKFDRLFRSLRQLLATVTELNDRGIALVSLKDNVDLSTPSGRFMMQIFGALAEFELDIIRTRIRTGLDFAKSKGIPLGRPKKCDADIERRVMELRAQGLSAQAISNQLERRISRSTVGEIIRTQAAEKGGGKPHG